MARPIVIATAASTDLGPPASSDHASPDMRSREIARSHDRTSHVLVWDCTAGRFTWHYDKDETFIVLSGEAFITDETDEERRIGAGDTVFFPAGTSSRWRVPNYIRKIAIMRHAMPRPVGFGVLVWSRLCRKQRALASAGAMRIVQPMALVSRSLLRLTTKLPVLLSVGIGAGCV